MLLGVGRRRRRRSHRDAEWEGNECHMRPLDDSPSMLEERRLCMYFPRIQPSLFPLSIAHYLSNVLCTCALSQPNGPCSPAHLINRVRIVIPTESCCFFCSLFFCKMCRIRVCVCRRLGRRTCAKPWTTTRYRPTCDLHPFVRTKKDHTGHSALVFLVQEWPYQVKVG